MGLFLEHPGPVSLFGHPRSKRYSALFDDGVLKVLNVAEEHESDPAGDEDPSNSLVEKMLEAL
jgi:peroxiredoxin